jgi:DNA-binding NarL/FixJ family response regulator
MANSRKARVLVADAEAVARYGLVQLVSLHPQLMVCAEAESLAVARQLAEKHKPEVIVLDPAFGDGFNFLKDLPRWCPGARAVVLTNLCDAHSVQRALKVGACAYVTRRDSVETVMAALVAAARGERFVGPRAQNALVEAVAAGGMQMRESDEAALSDRELQIFRLLGEGLGTRAVAEELHVSVKTVETHRQRIRVKLRLTNGLELQRRAVLSCGAAGREI